MLFIVKPYLLSTSFFASSTRFAVNPLPSSPQVTLHLNAEDHYVTQGHVNGVSVLFLLDTGASQVAISSQLADQLNLTYGAAQSVETANGQIEVYAAHIDNLQIGNIHLRHISALINPQLPAHNVLLGMNVLKKLDLHQQDQQLTLTQIPEHYATPKLFTPNT